MKCNRVYHIILCVCLALILAGCGSTAPAAPKAEQQENASDKTGSETNAPEAVEEIEAVEFDLRFFKDGENVYFDTPFETASLVIHP